MRNRATVFKVLRGIEQPSQIRGGKACVIKSVQGTKTSISLKKRKKKKPNRYIIGTKNKEYFMKFISITHTGLTSV